VFESRVVNRKAKGRVGFETWDSHSNVYGVYCLLYSGKFYRCIGVKHCPIFKIVSEATALKTEAVNPSETSVTFPQTIWQHIAKINVFQNFVWFFRFRLSELRHLYTDNGFFGRTGCPYVKQEYFNPEDERNIVTCLSDYDTGLDW
jgi:hypothetical protein